MGCHQYCIGQLYIAYHGVRFGDTDQKHVCTTVLGEAFWRVWFNHGVISCQDGRDSENYQQM